MIAFFQRSENGPLIHAIAGLIAILLSAGVGYVTSPDDPFRIGAPALGLIGVLGQVLVSWLRQYGKVTVKAGDLATVVGPDDTVVIATLGRKAPPPPPPAPLPDEFAPPKTDAWTNWRKPPTGTP